MNYLTLISHSWKSKSRSTFWQKSIAINIFLAILGVYLAANFVFLGVFLDSILASIFPDSSPLVEASRLLFYYFSFDVLLRFFLQELPVISIRSYLLLPVKKSMLFSFLLVRSVFGFFNILPFFVLVPFLIAYVIPTTSLLFGLSWIGSILLLVLSANFFAFFIKKYFILKPGFLFILLLILGGISYLDYSGSVLLSSYFGDFMMQIGSHPFWLVIPALLLVVCFAGAYQLLNKSRYFEETGAKKVVSGSGVFGFLTQFGRTGSLLLLEMRLIFRNKRPKTGVFIGLFFLFYGLMVYTNEFYMSSDLFPVGIGIFLTGFLMINHGQFIIAWDSSHFDYFLTRPISIREFILSKFWLLTSFALFGFMVNIPYVFFGYKILLINLAAGLFNMGVNTFVLIFMGLSARKRIDLRKGAMMNYEGVSAQHFLLIIPFLGFPVLLVYLFQLMGSSELGIAFIGFLGITGILFRDKIIDYMARKYQLKKYKMAVGFRKT